MACPTARMKQAEAFMSAIHQVRTYRIEDGNLLLLDAAGGMLAKLAPQRQELAGSAWRVTGYNNGKQAVVSVLRDSEITLAFSANGKVSGSASCNRYTGSYTLVNQQLTISSVAATRRMCTRPEDVMEQESQFLKALETVASARFEGNRLELRNAEGSLAVTLSSETMIDATAAITTSYTCGDQSVELRTESQGGAQRRVSGLFMSRVRAFEPPVTTSRIHVSQHNRLMI